MNTGEVVPLDLLSGLTYVNYLYFDLGALVSGLSLSPSENVVDMFSISNVAGDVRLVESGVDVSVSLDVATAFPLELDIGYVQIFVRDIDESQASFDILNLEVRGLSFGNGESTTLSAFMTVTPDSRRFFIFAH